ncbi:uncharacterized protein BT62DRAFT_943257 [Guyanagaster necrorhizus]|uniref:Uncharacterized protein n=1 Tax=Guyanagaster necrorhizus TaxID=856835 RepID=A0A9P8AW77_9AGAR|nr:uncharacterized protein BT62DRAFT_943257 [Guyanagaster necrorhizus MCA 3950]KAG7450349.1 hypothetical protein BT62DRAFT_943257 [Guyanagaster necrorhizus MCA 3950]
MTTEVVTTTTTQTTTHLISPLWRKHVAPVAAGRPTASQWVPLRVEKDLPPTPTDEDDSPSGPSSRPDSVEEIMAESMLPSLFPASDGRPCPEALPVSQSSTAALAHASLGVGLPHVLTRSSPSSPFSEVNTVAFATSPFPASRPALRQWKSSQKLRSASDTRDGTNRERRRTRGLSLNASTFLSFGMSDSKGKAKVKEGNEDLPPKTLSRRASFWTRKKTPASDLPTPPKFSPNSNNLYTPLPSVQPGSPFFMNMDASHSAASDRQSANQHTPHTRGLSRSHSERLSNSRLTLPEQSPPTSALAPSKARRRTRRPATADPLNTSLVGSLFTDSSHFTSSPLSNTSPPPPLPQRHDLEPPESQYQSRRPRAQTNPPLLHRLSLSLLFSSSGPSLQPSSPFTLVSSHLASTSSSSSSPVISNNNSPRPSLQKIVDIPRPRVDDESPEVYLDRLCAVVSKAEVAGVLASSADIFHVQALRAYISRFDFAKDPLDVALRRLLMDVGLPRETQQIDRVMEAFAHQYVSCHPNLFTSEDHPYILAFSLIMLHTDAFNKSNKRKMTKADYIKNTRLPGVSSEVLDCFYDNIVFAPFIFVEDPLDINGQRGFVSGGSRITPSVSGTASNGSGSGFLGKGNKVDPYYLISNNLLDALRVDVERYIPASHPYSWEGTNGRWDDDELQSVFANATAVEIGYDGRLTAPFFGMGSPPSPLIGPLGGLPDSSSPSGEMCTLRVTKAGVLSRKDDTLEGGKKSTHRKWRPMSVVLTGSQLLFFRDLTWANTLGCSSDSSSGGQVIYPQATVFNPDESISVKDCIAVWDEFYTKHRDVFRFVMHDGRQFLLQASNDKDLNEWVSRINYASSFKSAGVRIRPMGMSGGDVKLTGVAAATSHLHDLRHTNQATPVVRKWGGRGSHEPSSSLSVEPDFPTMTPSMQRKVTLMDDHDVVEQNVPVAPEVEGADQFKATFDQVKADLSAGRWSHNLVRADEPDLSQTAITPSDSARSDISGLPSRSNVILSKIRDLDSRISASQSQLDSDLRFVRNIATLTPFQRHTRYRLLLAIQGISKRIMQERLYFTKLACHRAVLSRDLAAEGREWNRTKQIALKAAAEMLQSQQPRESTIPTMTVSFHDSKDQTQSPESISRRASSTHRPESTCESFHSALDFGPEWPSSDDLASSNFLSSSQVYESPKASASEWLSYPFPEVNTSTSSVPRNEGPSSSRVSDEIRTHEKYYTAVEEAEEWDKTRCAQRVSLVRLPSTIVLRYERGMATSRD